MFGRILSFFGLGKKREVRTTVRLEVIQKQIDEFNESKKQINDKIISLEGKADELGGEVSKTLDMTKDNQARLESIEESLKRIMAMTEKMAPAKLVEEKAEGSPQ